MAVVKTFVYAGLPSVHEYSGLDADVKPIAPIPNNSTFEETNTGKKYRWDGVAWVQSVAEATVINSTTPIDVKVDDSTPVDINITNTSLVINDTTPIDVNITNTSIAINDVTPVNVTVTNAGIIVDDTTPLDVNITNTSIGVDDSTPINVSITNSISINDTTPIDVNPILSQSTAYKVVLAAGVASDIKLTPGYVFAINTALTDLTVLDDTVIVWEGNYSSGYPFYNATNIKLSSATGGTAYIVVK